MRARGRRETIERKPKTFWPGHLFAEAVAALIIFLLLVGASMFWAEPHESVAIPTDTSYIPRPEWYFLFLFELLKYFPGKLEPVAVLVIPGVSMLLLLLLPFIDRSPTRRPLRRPIATSLALIAMVGIVFLTYRAMSTTPPQVTSRTQLIAQGKVVYEQTGCASCHAINGVGGTVGPDLAGVGEKRTLSWLHLFIANPQAIVPGAVMPPFENTLGREDREAVALYMTTLRQEAVTPPAGTPTPAPTPTQTLLPGTPAATPTGGDPVAGKAVFDKSCNACHPGGSKGVGPALTRDTYKGTANDISQVVRQGKGSMPPFGPSAINDKGIQDLVAYMMTLGESAPPPTTAATPTPPATPTTAPTRGDPTPTPAAGPTQPATPTPTAAPTQPATPTPAGGDPTAGKAVFDGKCNACHPAGSAGLGPSLKRTVYTGTATEIEETVREGEGIMPAFGPSAISDKDMQDLIAYMMTLK